MLKYILLGLGFILLFEGLFYFLFAQKMKIIFEILNSFSPKKIQSFSITLIFLGFCLIYFTFKIYEL